MESVNTSYIKPGWVWLFAILVFFFNSLLPFGLTYTLLFTPVWIYLLHKEGQMKWPMLLGALLAIYACIHLYYGIYILPYLVSSAVLWANVCFLCVFFYCLRSPAINWDMIFKDIIILNFFFCLLSFALLFINPLKSVVWYLIPISANIPIVPRLKLFTEEASHYSLWLAIPVIYFFSRLFFFKAAHWLPVVIMLAIPLFMSFSLGVISCLFFTALLILCFYFRRIVNSRRRWIVVVTIFIAAPVLAAGLYHFFPHNPLFMRIANIFNGDDTSARGRTYESFILANKIAGLKSYWWGAGAGQVKIIGREVIIQYYSYYKIPDVIRIPNACAETIACFGYVGLASRLIILIALFFITKVYRNPFRLWLYLFMFIYQFTGSYLTNVTEYIIWLLAFSNIFPEFINKNQPQNVSQ